MKLARRRVHSVCSVGFAVLFAGSAHSQGARERSDTPLAPEVDHAQRSPATEPSSSTPVAAHADVDEETGREPRQVEPASEPDLSLLASATLSEDEIGSAFEDLSLIDLMRVQVVSASLVKEDAWTAPAVISVLTRRDLDDYRYTSIADALQYQPGFYVVYDYVNYNVGIRGINGGMGAQSQVLKTMIAGRDARFRLNAGSFLGPEAFPRFAIERVEIVRGPVSALYGADAFLGAVNIIPTSAKDMGEGNHRVALTTLNQWGNFGVQGDGAVWGEVLGLDALAAVSVKDTDRGGLALPSSSPLYDQLQSGLGTDVVGEDKELTVSAFSQLIKRWRGGSATMDSNLQMFRRGANFNYESSALSGAVASLYNLGTTLRARHQFEENLKLNGFVAYAQGGPTSADKLQDRLRQNAFTHLERTLDYHGTEERLELVYEDSISGIDVPYSVAFGGDHVWSDSALPSVHGIRPPPNAPLSTGPVGQRDETHNLGGFVQLRGRPLPWFSIIAGGRYEVNSVYGGQLSHRAGVAFANDSISTKILYGRSFKAPSVSLRHAQPIIGGGPVANPALSPQFGETVEVNVGYKPWRWLEMGVTGYTSKLLDFATIDTESFSPQAKNNTDINTLGAEFEIKVRHGSGFEGFANAAYASARRSSVDENMTDQKTPLFPEFGTSFGLQYRMAKQHLRLLVMDRYVTERRADNSNNVLNGGAYSLPSYNILSLGVFTMGLDPFGVGETVVGFKVDNILDERYVDPGFLGIDVPGQRSTLMFTVDQTL